MPTTNYYTGKIVDEFLEPLPYATINSVNDRTIWTVTDEDGKYYLNVPSTHNVAINMMGFETLTIPAFQLMAEYTVLKMDSSNQLNEVVITANKPKKDNTWLYAGLGILGLLAVVGLRKNKAGLAGGKTCTNRAKCTGLHKNGTLKKGYKFGKGGKVIKVASVKRRIKTTKKALNGGVVEVTI